MCPMSLPSTAALATLVLAIGCGGAKASPAMPPEQPLPEQASSVDSHSVLKVSSMIVCPSGTKRQDSKCVANVEVSCETGMHFEDGRGCVATANSASPPAATPRSGPGKNDVRVSLLDNLAVTLFYRAEFDTAISKLEEALQLCSSQRCSNVVHARALVHLGILLVNVARTDDAERAFAGAKRLDTSVSPDPQLASLDVQRAWSRAK